MRHPYSYAYPFVLACALIGGCSSSSECAAEDQVRGVCAGVPQAAVCDDDACTAGVSCAKVTQVGSDAELQAATSGAMPGECIVLAPGTYGAISLPGGVSLLGKSAADVKVGKVTAGAGEGAFVRGLTATGIHVAGATGLTVTSVRVSGSVDTGVLVDSGSSVALVTTTIEGAPRYGLFVHDAIDVSLDRVLIAGSGGPGLWTESAAECAAQPGGSTSQPSITAKLSVLRDNHIAGVAVFDARATFDRVDIRGTLPGDAFLYGKAGGGLSVACGSDIQAKGIRVNDNKSFGVRVEGSRGKIGGLGPDEDVEIHRNVVGASIEGIPESFELEGATLDQNRGIGLNISGEAHGVVICRTSVTRTVKIAMPTLDVGSKEIGDALVWSGESDATLTQVTLSGNALASVLIDGAASGTLDHVTLSGGDEALGIVQQNLTSGGAQPTTSGGTPSVQTNSGAVLPVPAPPAALPQGLMAP